MWHLSSHNQLKVSLKRHPSRAWATCPGGGISSQARGISADGSVVTGVGASSQGTEAFRWTADIANTVASLDIDNNGTPANDDTDSDGVPNYLDPDDDGDDIDDTDFETDLKQASLGIEYRF